jgi:xylulokinase
MTFRHDRGHFVRALYEGIAFSLRDVQEQFRAQGLVPQSARLVGGGARSATWRQILADVLQLEIRLPAVTDASFGAALVAGIGVGVFADAQDAVRSCVRHTCSVQPEASRRGLYDDMFGLYRQSQAGLRDVNHALSRLPQVS